MTPITLAQLAIAAGGELRGEDIRIAGYSTDTRSLSANDVYFCLAGDRFDGHDFIADAVAKGAAALVTEKVADTDIPQLVVSDGRLAFGLFSSLWRSQYTNPVVGVTGSNGKTTVKELLASIFRQAGTVHATRANDNNEVGVPQTLLGLSRDHDFAVVEMGASDVGEIERLGSLVKPDVAVITNAGAAHLEGFGDAESVAAEKAWIYKSLASDGTAVINATDNFYDYWIECSAGKRIISFGGSGVVADVTAERLVDGTITIRYKDQSVNCQYGLPGHHNVLNAAAASACSIAAGVSLGLISQGLASVQPVAGRLNFSRLNNGVTLIDDTYNANPASTRAAIDVLSESTAGLRVLVLGDLLELGAEAVQEHQAVGVYAHANGIDRLFAFGDLTQHTVDAFGNGAEWFSDKEAIVSKLRDELLQDSVVLVKGSRSMHMEEVADALTVHCNQAKLGACCQ